MSPRTTTTERDDDDAAAVLAVLFSIAGPAQAPPPSARSIWGEPGHRIGLPPAPSATAWWASGMPR